MRILLRSAEDNIYRSKEWMTERRGDGTEESGKRGYSPGGVWEKEGGRRVEKARQIFVDGEDFGVALLMFKGSWKEKENAWSCMVASNR